MKQSDIFTLILVAGIGTLAAFFVCNWIMGDPDLATTEFKALNSTISKTLAAPDPEVFNPSAINPTIEVFVGDCVDIDQNGMLDMAELIACGKEMPPQVSEEMPENELRDLMDGDGCVLTTDGNTVCDDEKRAYIENLLNGE